MLRSLEEVKALLAREPYENSKAREASPQSGPHLWLKPGDSASLCFLPGFYFFEATWDNGWVEVEDGSLRGAANVFVFQKNEIEIGRVMIFSQSRRFFGGLSRFKNFHARVFRVKREGAGGDTRYKLSPLGDLAPNQIAWLDNLPRLPLAPAFARRSWP